MNGIEWFCLLSKVAFKLDAEICIRMIHILPNANQWYKIFTFADLRSKLKMLNL